MQPSALLQNPCIIGHITERPATCFSIEQQLIPAQAKCLPTPCPPAALIHRAMDLVPRPSRSLTSANKGFEGGLQRGG